MTGEEVLQDGVHRRVVRIGDTVRRPAQPWTPTVHALLRHLAEVGFDRAPRPLGLDDQGREVLTFIEGDCGPAGWARVADDHGLRAFAHLLRDYHQACAGFAPPSGATWAGDPQERGETAGPDRDPGEPVVCHGDFGPWNVVWRGRRPVGIIDWDFARPAPRLHDIAYALEYTAPFRDDTECLHRLHHPQVPDRRRRLELFCTAYGLDSAAGVPEAVIDRQQDTTELVRRLAAQGRQPQATWVANGYLAELERRTAWSRAHRHLFA
ncbi:phosphotransferase enzyme family protein [Kitasatospora sp. NPDC056327]|uniref:phosphotransferase enzyme family protein n=1 Tax=Kitasatospora sp. NPDC056327 TaxID=3345785 RepID=UPI0035E30A7A